MGKHKSKILIIATSNKDRLQKNKRILNDNFPSLKISGLDKTIKKPEETGKTEKQNAILKARYYYNILNKPILCIDDGIYLQDRKDIKQIGSKIHRLDGVKDKTSQEIYDYWYEIIKHDSNLIGKWKRVVVVCVLGNIFVKTLTREIKFVLPKVRQSKIIRNPLNYFMIPCGCSTVLQSISAKERKEYEKKIVDLFELLFKESKLI